MIELACRKCGATFKTFPSDHRKYCSRACYFASKTPKPALALIEKFYETGPGCWEWTGYRDPRGYGRHRHRQAHREVYQCGARRKVTSIRANSEHITGVNATPCKRCGNTDEPVGWPSDPWIGFEESA